MSKLTFIGEDRRIQVSADVSILDVETDLYSAWKNWSVEENNLKFPQAFRTFGGDQTISGQFAPKYFFLTNGWRIIVDTGKDLLVGVNLYTDELDSPFIVSNNSTVSLNNSDAAVVDRGISETLDYNGIIHLNSIIGVAGSDYPVGTLAQPVNNISDAKKIAIQYGIQRIHIRGPVVIDEDLEEFVIYGGNLTDIVTIQNVSCDKTTFAQVLLEGSYTGEIAGDNCILNSGLTGMNGYFQYCGFAGNLIFSPNANCVLNDCHSQVPGMNSPALYLDEGVQLSVRKYSGGLAVYDAKNGVEATLEFLVGNCRLLTGNTGGTIVVRGLATLTDNTSGTNVITEGMVVPNTIPTKSDIEVINRGIKKASILVPHNEDIT